MNAPQLPHSLLPAASRERTVRKHARELERWCAEHGHPTRPAPPAAIAGWLADWTAANPGKNPSNRLNSAVRDYKNQGCYDPRAFALARKYCSAVRKTLPGRDPVDPLLRRDLALAAHGRTETPAGAVRIRRNRHALVLARAARAPLRQLAACPAGTALPDPNGSPGIVLHLPDLPDLPARTVLLQPNPGNPCPVQAAQDLHTDRPPHSTLLLDTDPPAPGTRRRPATPADLTDQINRDLSAAVRRCLVHPAGTPRTTWAEPHHLTDAAYLLAHRLLDPAETTRARDLALHTTGHDQALRGNELGRARLHWLTRHDRHYTIRVPHTKTSRTAREFDIHPTGGPDCPVAALDDWTGLLRQLGAHPDQPLFPRIQNHGHVKTAPQQSPSLRRSLKTRTQHAGIPGRYGIHSIRSGAATDTAARTGSLRAVQASGNWESPAVAQLYNRHKTPPAVLKL